MEKRVAIVGAGISGLLACKYVLQAGFNPVVYEADDGVGGLWRHTIESTKIQIHKSQFEFIDFPWDSSVKEDFPTNQQVAEYLNSYAQHFSIIPCIKFNTKVIDIDYVGESDEEMKSWELWSGNNSPFGSMGQWHITVEDTKSFKTEVHKFEFVILCIGKHSGVPNMPEFPLGKGPEVFNGKVMHSMDYSALNNDSATELIKNKRITVVGSGKSAIELATECANKNGVTHPCTIIQRGLHWFLPSMRIWGLSLAYFYYNRFAELSIHKPGEHFLLSFLVTLLSPLKWGINKLVETYIKWKIPLKEYGLLPNHSFNYDLYRSKVVVITKSFFQKMKEGSIVIKKSQSFSFCNEGLIIDGETKPIESDLVIFATGYNGNLKLTNIFKSPSFQKYLTMSTNVAVPLYRLIIPPRIPQLAIIGYAESFSNIYCNEMRCQWLVKFLEGNINLPNIKEMEKDCKVWEDTLRKYDRNWDLRITTCQIWYNDQLCKDMKCNNKRKKNVFAELFEPYGPSDYKGLLNN